MPETDVEARYKQQLAKKERMIRALSTSDKARSGDPALLRKALRASYAMNDVLIERIDKMERDHEAEIAEIRAQHTRELNHNSFDGSKGGSKSELDKGGADGATLLNSPATPPPNEPGQVRLGEGVPEGECRRVREGEQGV